MAHKRHKPVTVLSGRAGHVVLDSLEPLGLGPGTCSNDNTPKTNKNINTNINNHKTTHKEFPITLHPIEEMDKQKRLLLYLLGLLKVNLSPSRNALCALNVSFNRWGLVDPLNNNYQQQMRLGEPDTEHRVFIVC